jgi:sRNA-binding protein
MTWLTRSAANARIQELAALFPVFQSDAWRPHPPLKRGIHLDLIELGAITEDEARSLFRHYTSRICYQKGLAAGGSRFDLTGAPDGEVLPQEVAAAAKAVEDITAKRIAHAKTSGPAYKAQRRSEIAAERKASEAAANQRALHETAAAPAGDIEHAHVDAPPPAPAEPRRMSLADLKIAAQRRRAEASFPDVIDNSTPF